MRVKIIDSKLNFWYKDHIGEYFEVEEYDKCNLIYKVKNTKDRWIYKEHCVVARKDFVNDKNNKIKVIEKLLEINEFHKAFSNGVISLSDIDIAYLEGLLLGLKDEELK